MTFFKKKFHYIIFMNCLRNMLTRIHHYIWNYHFHCFPFFFLTTNIFFSHTFAFAWSKLFHSFTFFPLLSLSLSLSHSWFTRTIHPRSSHTHTFTILSLFHSHSHSDIMENHKIWPLNVGVGKLQESGLK